MTTTKSIRTTQDMACMTFMAKSLALKELALKDLALKELAPKDLALKEATEVATEVRP